MQKLTVFQDKKISVKISIRSLSALLSLASATQQTLRRTSAKQPSAWMSARLSKQCHRPMSHKIHCQWNSNSFISLLNY